MTSRISLFLRPDPKWAILAYRTQTYQRSDAYDNIFCLKEKQYFLVSCYLWMIYLFNWNCIIYVLVYFIGFEQKIGAFLKGWRFRIRSHQRPRFWARHTSFLPIVEIPCKVDVQREQKWNQNAENASKHIINQHVDVGTRQTLFHYCQSSLKCA